MNNELKCEAIPYSQCKCKMLVLSCSLNSGSMSVIFFDNLQELFLKFVILPLLFQDELF